MKTLFLVDGAAGTGKSDLLRYLSTRKKTAVTTIKKYTTRGIRDEEKKRQLPLDLRFPPDSYSRFKARTVDSEFYWYQYGSREFGEHLYGFHKKDVEEALRLRDVAVVIVRDRATIDQIKSDFPSVRCISVFIYTDRDLVVQRLKADGYDDEAIEFRLSRQPAAWADYLKFWALYDETIINSSDRKDFELLIEALFQKHLSPRPEILRVSSGEEFTLTRPLVGFHEAMEKRLAKYPYEHNVFLMMKFRDSNALSGEFMRESLGAYGLNGVKANDPEWQITGNTYNPVAVLYCCKFGIALFDQPEPGCEYSPNVAYELGMMHHQGKQCLIIRHSSLDQVPFDLVKDLHENYTDPLELRHIIGRWVKSIAPMGRRDVAS